MASRELALEDTADKSSEVIEGVRSVPHFKSNNTMCSGPIYPRGYCRGFVGSTVRYP